MSEAVTVSREMFDDVMVPNYAPADVIPVKGEGSRVWDQDGKEYIDLAGGIAVTALGHAHPALTEALNEQAASLWHMSNVFATEPALRLAKRLTDLTFAEQVFFANSGAEANEAAFKLARRYAYDHAGPHKHNIVSCSNSFHGRTLFTVSVGGQQKYREGFEPVPAGIVHTPFNDITALEQAIDENTCAFVVEPIQGESGVRPADKEFLQKARALCDEKGALLIFDEIQTGVGRSGKLYAYMEYGVVPDILTTAKALGNGFPIAAMLTRSEVAKSLVVGTHGSTYGGNPMGCAVADKTLQIISRTEVLSGVIERHQQLIEGLEAINRQYQVFSEIRGLGLLVGAQMAGQHEEKTRQLMMAALEAGVLVLVAGPHVLRFAPSLIIPLADLKEGLGRLKQAIGRVLDDDQNETGN